MALSTPAAVAVVIGAFLVSTPAALAEPLDLELINGTSRDLEMVEVATACSGAFGDNALGGAFLPAGNSVTLAVADSATGCSYDLRFTFASGNPIEDAGVDICATPSYTLGD